MRDLKIDAIKGFAIIAVIWGHISVLTANITNGNQELWLKLTKQIDYYFPVYFFHIPLFFALSIFFTKKFSINFTKKRILAILVPYVLWHVYFLKNTFVMENPIILFKNIIYGNWPHLNSILWFLPALFSINIYYSLYKKYPKKILPIFILAWIIIFIFAESIAKTYHIYIPFGIDIAIYLFPYLLILENIYKNKDYIKKINHWYMLTLIPLYIILISTIYYFENEKTFTPFHHRIDLAQFTVPFTLTGYLAMTLLSGLILIFFLRIKKCKILAYIGKYSLPIYLFHLLAIQKLTPIYTNLALNNEIFFVIAILFSIPLIIVISILLSKLLFSITKYSKYIGMIE